MADRSSALDQATALKRRLTMTIRRSAKACFLEPDGRTLTYEGRILLKYLRKAAKLETAFFGRDATLRIDPLQMARVEGRREIVLDLMNLLQADAMELGNLMEVDNAKL